MKLNKTLVYPHERVDDLQCGGYRIIQDPNLFCFGMDAVCLSNFAIIKQGETVLDLGTGTGVIPILLCAKTLGGHFTGLEIQQTSVDMAVRSVKMNGLSDRIRIDHGDIKKAAELYPPNHFNVVTVNPPYINTNGGIPNMNKAKAIARHEISCTLEDIATLSSKVLKTGGRMYMVHRPHRLVDILCTLRMADMEPKTIQFVQSGPSHRPSLVLVEAVDHGRAMVKIKPTLFLS